MLTKQHATDRWFSRLLQYPALDKYYTPQSPREAM